MDQQCTVVRPGLAPVAGALAVELLVAVLQHPEGEAHPESLLGAVPHSVRGFFGQFSQKVFRCPACSEAVTRAYAEGGADFLLSVFNQPSVLEDLTGLSALQRAAAEAALDWDEEGDEEGLGGEVAGGASPGGVGSSEEDE